MPGAGRGNGDRAFWDTGENKMRFGKKANRKSGISGRRRGCFDGGGEDFRDETGALVEFCRLKL